MKTIQLCHDGKYRWAYELSLYKNPHILFLIWKIMGWILAGISLFLMIVQLFSGNTSFEELVVFPLQLFFGIGGKAQNAEQQCHHQTDNSLQESSSSSSTTSQVAGS